MRRDKKPKAEKIHRSKLFGGVATAQEVHAKYGFRQACQATGCGATPVIQIKMFMLHDEFCARNPRLAAMIAMTNEAGHYVPAVPTTFGPMVMFSKVSACRGHQKELEREAAKAPSYVMVEIDRGPDANKAQAQVPNMLRS